jgi:enamine deaminase RidA (YjgF/YER057c/UK114 family)
MVRRNIRMTAWILVLGLGACQREHETEAPPARVKQVFHLNGYEKDFGYSQAVLVDKTLYVSGSVAADQNGRLVAPGRHGGQMRAAYTNIRRTLAAHGADFDEVVKETIYTTDMDALAESLGCAVRVLRQRAAADDLVGSGAAFGGSGIPR